MKQGSIEKNEFILLASANETDLNRNSNYFSKHPFLVAFLKGLRPFYFLQQVSFLRRLYNLIHVFTERFTIIS